MQIFCSICNDLFDQQSDITVAQCGHVYHEACIFRWFETQRNCPKCRCQVQKTAMRKVYFDVDEENNPLLEAYQKKVESLSIELEEKELIIKLLDEDNKKLQENNESLQEDVSNHKVHEQVYKSTILALEKKVSSLKKSDGILEEKLMDSTNRKTIQLKV